MRNRGTRPILFAGLLTAFILFFPFRSNNGYAFSGCEENCQKCHSLNDQEVKNILEKVKAPDAKVLKIQMSPIKGLWEVAVEDKEQRGVLYIDFSKKYLVKGPIVEVHAAVNKTQQRLEELNKDKRINPANIPVKEALILGSNTATKKVIVFTDPDCPFCGKVHEQMKKVVAQRMDIAFYIKLFPLKMHPDAYWKSKSIQCDKSITLLEENFEKKPIPKNDCDTKEIDKTIKIAEKNGITGTPTLILPDGSIQQGNIEAEKLIKLIDEASSKAAKAPKKKKG